MAAQPEVQRLMFETRDLYLHHQRLQEENQLLLAANQKLQTGIISLLFTLKAHAEQSRGVAVLLNQLVNDHVVREVFRVSGDIDRLRELTAVPQDYSATASTLNSSTTSSEVATPASYASPRPQLGQETSHSPSPVSSSSTATIASASSAAVSLSSSMTFSSPSPSPSPSPAPVASIAASGLHSPPMSPAGMVVDTEVVEPRKEGLEPLLAPTSSLPGSECPCDSTSISATVYVQNTPAEPVSHFSGHNPNSVPAGGFDSRRNDHGLSKEEADYWRTYDNVEWES